MSTLSGIVGFAGMALMALAFVARHDGMLIGGAVLLGAATIAAAVERQQEK